MLKLKYLVENFDLARMALEHWPHDEATLPERFARFRISANAVYPFDMEGKLCFLRLTPAEETSSPLIREELRLIRRLRSEGYPAMEPIPASDGEDFITLHSPWGIWYACAFAGVPGKPLEDIDLTEDILFRYGEALGRMHRLNMEYLPAPTRPNFLHAMKWIKDVMEDAPYPLFHECDTVREELSQLWRGPWSYGMIHGDFEPDNVFWDGERCHVIDFNDSMLHFYALDVVNALDELPPEAAEPFLRGYRAACPESEVKEADFPLMRRFRQLHKYARMLHALSERPDPEPDWMPGLVEKLRGMMHDIEENVTAERRQRKRQWLNLDK